MSYRSVWFEKMQMCFRLGGRFVFQGTDWNKFVLLSFQTTSAMYFPFVVANSILIS